MRGNTRRSPSPTFLPDGRKEGGEYATLTGRLKRLDPVERVLLFEAGERVPIGDILSVAEH